MNREVPTLESVLRQQRHSVTSARQTVFNALLDSGPITIQQLTNKVRAQVDRASVYRTVDLFEKLGIVNRLQMGWKYKLELSDLFTEHHHHATCLQCGSSVALEEDVSLETGIHLLAQEAGFMPTGHSLEIHGLCATCRKINKQ